MLIVWGSLARIETEGYCAGFCPLCRDISGIRIERMGSQSHLYGIGVGGVNWAGYRAVCRGCGLLMPADPMSFPLVMDELPATVLILFQKTQPRIGEGLRSRLELEWTVRNAPERLGKSQRRALMLEPLIALHPVAETLPDESGWIGLGILALALGCLLAPLCLLGAIFGKAATPSDRIVPIVLSLLCPAMSLGFAWYCYQRVVNSPAKRQMRKSILDSLALLDPTRKELAEMVEAAEAMNVVTAQKVGVDRLFRDMEERIQRNAAPPNLGTRFISILDRKTAADGAPLEKDWDEEAEGEARPWGPHRG